MITKRRVAMIMAALVAGLLLLAVLYTWISLTWAYSEGDRAGYLQKFSKKGWICKTWEGELLLTSMPGAIPEKFIFTVRDDALARQVESALGKRVVLVYTQHKGVPSSCFGDTSYFVNSLKSATTP
jgi:hypothetical protein